MSIEGELHIRLHTHEGSVDQVEIQSSRPLRLTQVFKGKSVDELLHMIPMLYSVCGTAQAAAAVQACRQASCVESDSHTVLLETILVNVETAREHLWRIIINWSAVVGQAFDRNRAASLSSLISDAKQACFPGGDDFTLEPTQAFDSQQMEAVIERIATLSGDLVFGLSPTTWYGIECLQEFDEWLDQTETSSSLMLKNIQQKSLSGCGDGETAPLPDFDRHDICMRLAQADAEAFIASPDWNGNVYETGPMTRQDTHPLIRQLMQKYGRGLMPRFVARLMELASLPGCLTRQLSALELQDPVTEKRFNSQLLQQGVGEVEAARGRLIHRAVLDNEVISSYQILAPTEWNFHPRGVVAQGLKRLSAVSEEELIEQARLLIGAVDPCVGYRLEIL